MQEPADETVELLRRAVRLLEVLATPQLRELRERFDMTLLTSAKRREMWTRMDGTRSLSEIAGEVGVTSEAVRLFLREAQESFPQLIDTGDGSAGMRPTRHLI
ncbi:MAG: hypothetical protein WD939_10450 [Dehalococcoidia bacterium]